MDQEAEKNSVKRKVKKIIDLNKKQSKAFISGKTNTVSDNLKLQNINWQPWGKNAFELAKKENKPILLDLSAVWCHWCHRMDHDTYDTAQVIDVVNSKFVAIKVDIDQRPDIRDRYNFGGFPTTAFLTDTGKVITGHTYLPKDQMLHLLAQVSTFYNSLKIEAEAKQSSMQAKKLQHNAGNSEKEITLNYSTLGKISEFLTSNFDSTFGGFGTQPKFPVTEAVEFALLQCSKNTAKDESIIVANKKYTEIAKQTLKGMLGIFDKVEGGFFRYSVTQDWTLPHYEKMAESNAELIRNYLNAHQLLRESVGNEFKDVAIQTLGYVQNTLYDAKTNVFYASQDADEEYYKRSKEQRKKLSKPYVDKTIFTNLNAQMISAFLRASVVLNDKKYSDVALTALKYLYKNNTNKTGNAGNVSAGFIHYSLSKKDRKDNKNKPSSSDLDSHSGLLIDQVYMLRALLGAFQVTQDKKYLEDAEKLFAYVKSNFYDKDDQAFSDRIISKEDIGYLQFPDKSLLDNSLLADSLVRLYSLTSKEGYPEIAAGILKAFSHDFNHHGFNAAGYALALEHYLFPIKIVIVAKKKDQVEELLNLVLAAYDPRKSVKLLTLEDKKELAESGYSVESTPTIYICYGTMCSRPMKSYEEFVKEFGRIKGIKK